jgi:hypothetical protein
MLKLTERKLITMANNSVEKVYLKLHYLTLPTTTDQFFCSLSVMRGVRTSKKYLLEKPENFQNYCKNAGRPNCTSSKTSIFK